MINDILSIKYLLDSLFLTYAMRPHIFKKIRNDGQAIIFLACSVLSSY